MFVYFDMFPQVVYIVEKKHSRSAMGHIQLHPDPNHQCALFTPNDRRVPRILVPLADCPKGEISKLSETVSYLW